jgi:hypothetical protein
MPFLPPVLDAAELPLPERMAAALDAELFPLGDAHCPIDEVETPALRLAAVLAGRPARLIAELGTAAWVWGAAPCAPRLLELCVDLRARARPAPAPHASVREVVLTADEWQVLGARRVTTPLRTAIDLARARESFGAADQDAVRALARIGGFTLVDCVTAMDLRRNLPARRRAVQRLSEALVPQPAFTRYTS